MMKILPITVTICAVVLFSACSGESENFNTEASVIPSVEAVQAQFGSLPLEERLSGVVRSQQQVEIYPRISAPIEEVYVQNGEQVEKGDPLVKLRDTEYRERLRQSEADLRINKAREKQAEASLNEAESQLRRQQILADRELSSELEMERLQAQKQSAEANYELALAQVEQAESNVAEQQEILTHTIIRSPIDGTVGQRTADIGMQVSNNTHLFSVGNLNDAKITINLTERMLSYIHKDQKVKIQSENLGDRMLEGTVSRISPFLGAGNFSTEAEIDIENTRDLLIPGMFVTVDIFYGESEQATLIPLSAIYRHPRTGETGVFIAPEFGAESEPIDDIDSANPPPLSEPKLVEFVSIDVIARGRESAGVSGIESGDWVVTVGQNMLINNETETARIRAVSWNRIMGMQKMQPQDLLRDIMNDRMAHSADNQSTQS